MKTREKEIREAAIHYDDTFCSGGIRDAFEAGAEYADAHPKSPWRDAKKELPKKPKNKLLINANWVIATREGSSGFFKAYYDYDKKVWRILDGLNFIDIIAPDYWMPIPELPKGGEK